MRTALVAIGRLENEYAREWVGHHLSVGFDHIIIYDNNHHGEEYFEDVLQDYINCGKVKIVSFRDREKAQRAAYNDAISRFATSYDWLAFFDFDEFLCFGGDCPDVRSLLMSVPATYGCIMIPWLMMTDSGLVRNDHRPLLERFTESLDEPSTLGKCIVKANIRGLLFTSSVHVPYHPSISCCTPLYLPTNQHRRQPQDTSVAYLKHFSTKTIEEWLTNKWRKGAAGVSYSKFQEQYRDYFFKINQRTPEKESFINSFRQ